MERAGPRLAWASESESFTVRFNGGSCNVIEVPVDGGCWLQVNSIVQGDPRSFEYTHHSVRFTPRFVSCDGGIHLCDSLVGCDCRPRPPPRGFEAMATDGGERTGNTKPKRRL